jgi:hypothetical protein
MYCWAAKSFFLVYNNTHISFRIYSKAEGLNKLCGTFSSLYAESTMVFSASSIRRRLLSTAYLINTSSCDLLTNSSL